MPTADAGQPFVVVPSTNFSFEFDDEFMTGSMIRLQFVVTVGASKFVASLPMVEVIQ